MIEEDEEAERSWSKVDNVKDEDVVPPSGEEGEEVLSVDVDARDGVDEGVDELGVTGA